MKWIGLTGGIGCGKTTALSLFEAFGCGTVSADQIVNEIYQDQSLVDEIKRILEISVQEEGLLEIKIRISEEIFSNLEKRKKLENFIHPLVRKKSQSIKNNFLKEQKKIAFYEVPLLFENNLENQFDKTVCIWSSSDVQWKRIKSRNPWSDQEIKNRLSSQMSLEKKKEKADYCIDNSYGFEDLKESCRGLLEKLLEV